MARNAIGLETGGDLKAIGGDGNIRPAWFGGRRMLRYNLESSSKVSFSVTIMENSRLRSLMPTWISLFPPIYVLSMCQHSRELYYGQNIAGPTPSPTIDWLWNNDGYPPDNLVTDAPTESPVGWTRDGWNDDGYPIKPPASPKCVAKSSQIVSVLQPLHLRNLCAVDPCFLGSFGVKHTLNGNSSCIFVHCAAANLSCATQTQNDCVTSSECDAFWKHEDFRHQCD